MSKNKTVASMTLNKLRFDRVWLRGRDEEVAALNGCFDRLLLVAEKEGKSAAKSRSKEEKESESAPLDQEDKKNKEDKAERRGSLLSICTENGDAQPKSQREMVFISGLSGKKEFAKGTALSLCLFYIERPGVYLAQEDSTRPDSSPSRRFNPHACKCAT